MATDAELRDQAVAYLKRTTVGWNKVAGYSPERLAATNWGKAMDLLARIGAAPPPPPPSSGVLRDSFTDFYTGWGSSSTDHNGQIFKNRWRNTDDRLQTLTTTPQTPWPSIGGPAIEEVTTPTGPGFRVRCNPEMLNDTSGGAYAKKVEIVEYYGNQYGRPMARGAGYTDEVAYHLRFPSAGNPDGFPVGYDRANVFWQHSLDSVNRLILFGIDMRSSAQRFFLSVLRDSGAGTEAYAVETPWQVQFDRDYHMRYVVRWSAMGDGYLQWWIDDVLVGDYRGVTCPSNDRPDTEFGLYMQPISLDNEAVFSDLRVTAH